MSGLSYRERSFLDRLAAEARWQEKAPGRAALLKDLAACVGRERVTENIDRVVELASAAGLVDVQVLKDQDGLWRVLVATSGRPSSPDGDQS